MSVEKTLSFMQRRDVRYKQLIDFMQSCGGDDFAEPEDVIPSWQQGSVRPNDVLAIPPGWGFGP